VESRIDQNLNSSRIQVTEVNKLVALAFVMINAQVGAEQEIVDAVKMMEHVKEAYVAYGVYDVLVKLEAETAEKLKEAIASLRRLSRVRSTLTMPVKE
jgi:hypothetical protein